MLNVFWIWIGFGLIGVGLAFALRLRPRPAVRKRNSACPSTAASGILRRLRMQGLDEEEIRQFVAKFAGRNWEEFFEALFGYEAKLDARAVLLRGGAAGVREKHAAWREPLIAAMDRIEKARKAARERALLQAVERAELLAAGATPEAAENQAKAAADAMVRAAGEARAAEDQCKSALAPRPTPVNIRNAVVAAEENPFAFIPNPSATAPARSSTSWSGRTFACWPRRCCWPACGLWVHQNGLIPTAEVQRRPRRRWKPAISTTSRPPPPAISTSRPGRWKSLSLPREATAWVDGWNIGLRRDAAARRRCSSAAT